MLQDTRSSEWGKRGNEAEDLKKTDKKGVVRLSEWNQEGCRSGEDT